MDPIILPPDAWQTTAVLLVVELDDWTHQRAGRRRDVLVDVVLRSAGVPIVRVKAAARYNTGEIRRLLERTLAG